MTAADIAAVITAVAGLVVAVTALIHSVQTRSQVTASSNSMARAATGIVRQGPSSTAPGSK